MAYPTMECSGRRIIVLDHIEEILAAGEPASAERLDPICEAVRRNPDAVAFSYFAGSWVPAA